MKKAKKVAEQLSIRYNDLHEGALNPTRRVSDISHPDMNTRPQDPGANRLPQETAGGHIAECSPLKRK